MQEAAPGASRLIAEAIPRLVDELTSVQPGRVHRGALELVERPLLAYVLGLTRGNQLRAARLLGLNRNTLRKRCRELGLASPRAARGRAPVPDPGFPRPLLPGCPGAGTARPRPLAARPCSPRRRSGLSFDRPGKTSRSRPACPRHPCEASRCESRRRSPPACPSSRPPPSAP